MSPFTKCLLVVGALAFAGYATEKQDAVDATPESRRAEYCGDTHDSLFFAYSYAKDFVERRLKAPSTADFGGFRDPDVTTARVSGCEFLSKGYVDAQNSFGAKIRTPYSVTLEYLPEKKAWRAENINFGS